MQEDIIVPVTVTITVFACLFGIAFLYFTTRHKERILLIQQGADPAIFKKVNNPLSILKWGMLFIGVGIGTILGYCFANIIEPETSYVSMILLCGGISLVLFFIIQMKMRKNNV